MRLFQKPINFFRRIRQLEIPIYAAYTSYFLILAVFPAMMLLIGTLQFTPINPADLRSLLERIIPFSLGGLLDYMIEELFAENSVAMLSVSAVFALWMASRGIVSLHKGLNRVYAVRETRNGFRIHLRSVVFTLVAVLAMVVLLAINLLSKNLIGLLLSEGSFIGKLLLRLSRLKYLLSVALLIPFFTAIYCVVPNRKSRIGEALPGAFAAAVLWVIFTQLFSLYTEYIANFSIYYGSLSVIAVAMFWQYICTVILFGGGVLNYELERAKRRKAASAETSPDQKGQASE